MTSLNTKIGEEKYTAYLINLGVRFIVFECVIKHQNKIGYQIIKIFITISLQFLRNYFKVDGPLDNFVIIRILLQSNDILIHNTNFEIKLQKSI